MIDRCRRIEEGAKYAKGDLVILKKPSARVVQAYRVLYVFEERVGEIPEIKYQCQGVKADGRDYGPMVGIKESSIAGLAGSAPGLPASDDTWTVFGASEKGPFVAHVEGPKPSIQKQVQWLFGPTAVAMSCIKGKHEWEDC